MTKSHEVWVHHHYLLYTAFFSTHSTHLLQLFHRQRIRGQAQCHWIYREPNHASPPMHVRHVEDARCDAIKASLAPTARGQTRTVFTCPRNPGGGGVGRDVRKSCSIGYGSWKVSFPEWTCLSRSSSVVHPRSLLTAAWVLRPKGVLGRRDPMPSAS